MNYENKIIDAIEAIVNNAVQKANYDKTIQAIVMRCLDKNTGKYLVKYQDALIEAYSNDIEQIYSSGVAVYVLVPSNDMSQIKTIIGTVDKLGTNYIETLSGEQNYQIIGNSITSSNDTFEICSYKNPDVLFLYDIDDLSHSLINIDDFASTLYFKDAKYLIINADFKTNLVKEQRYKGDYGLAFDLEYTTNDGGSLIKTYLLNVNNMLGNPYEYFDFTKQKVIYEINGENFSRIKRIYFYGKDFINQEEGHDNDIFVKNIELLGAVENENLNNANNYLNLFTNQGIYFDNNDENEAIRSIYAQVIINNKIIEDNSKELQFYWFKLNRRITSSDLLYNRFGGNGWECLNTYTIDNNITQWDSSNCTYETKKIDNVAKENNYKCVIVYNNELVLSKEFTIYNYSSPYEIIITSNEGFNFYNNNGNPTLACDIVNQDVNLFNFYWSYIDSNGQFNNITTASSNELNVKVNEVYNYNIYICSVYRNNVLIGEAKAIITNEISNEISYNVIIENGKQLFKYDEQGLAPTSKKFDNPQEIYPLSFKIYDSRGIEVDLDTIDSSNYSWIVPNQDTMIEILDSQGTPTEIDDINHNNIYSGARNLFFRISSIYDYKKLRNTIELRIKYNNKIISALTDFTFIKEGENGSNGTDYICKIILNNADANSKLNYPIVYHNNDNNSISLNYNRPSGQENIWFKVLIYKDGERQEIFNGNASGMSTEGNMVNIKWEMLKNKYSNSKMDVSNFNVNVLTGEMQYQNYGISAPANILKCTVKYNDIDYVIMMPITLAEITTNYKINLIENTGFRTVFYSSDGRQPKYENTTSFKLKVLNSNIDITDNVNYSWSKVGNIYLNGWVNSDNLIKIDELSNSAKYSVSENYNGYCVNNSVICTIANVGKIYIPVYFYLNKYGNAALNDWDGNSIQLNEDGGYILTPQIGAGYKNQENQFTGVFMGTVAQEEEEKTGLFGYSDGVQTIFLNAESGSATFGKTDSGQIIIEPSEDKAILKSGTFEIVLTQASGKYKGGRVYFQKVGNNYTRLKENVDYNVGDNITGNNIYVWSGGEGLEIDLNDPHIYFGSGKFRLESSGDIYAEGYATIADLENGEYTIPTSSVENLDNFIEQTADDIEDLQNQIDGNITTWFNNYVPKPRYDYPTESANEPASSWTSPQEKENHVGDLFYDSTTGYCYRYMPKEVSGTTYYVWLQLSDSDIAEALAVAEQAQDTADSKRRIFYSQPIPPYDEGDLWTQGSSGDIKVCTTPRTENESFNASDWSIASKYTDDTAVNNLTIGGRNLLLATSNIEWSFNTKWSDNYVFSNYAKQYIKATDTLTISFEAKGSVEMYFDIYYRSSTQSYNSSSYFFPSFHATTEYQKFVFTGVSGIDLTDMTNIRIRQNATAHGSAAAIGDLYIKNLKFERGNKPTDWTAAPEDAIETIDVEYYLSTSKTTTSGGSWQTTAPEWVDGKYMWSRQKVIYGSGAYVTRNATCIAGATGETGSGIKYYGTRSWTDAQITETYVIGYESTWTNNLGIEVKAGDLLLLEVTNTTYNTKYQYILETISVNSEGKPRATVVAITQDGHDGEDGEDAKVVNISASSQIFKSTTGSMGTFTPQYIYLYPSFQNATYSKWGCSTDGTTWEDITSGEHGFTIGTYNSVPNSLRISRTCDKFTDSITSLSFKCSATDANIYNTISIVKIYDVTELEVGGRNLIYYGKGDNKLGFFKNFSVLDAENGYCQHSFTSQKEYKSVSLKPGYIIPIADYPEGQNIRFSFDIMYTAWNFPEGSSTGEFWIGQRYNAPSWKGMTQFNMPKPGITEGCELNQWYHFSGTKKIPSQPEDTSSSNSAVIQFYNPNDSVTASMTFRMKNVKLEFGNLETDWTPSPEEVQDQINKNASDLAEAILAIDGDIENLQSQIDGNITTWFYDYVPTLNNAPANTWTTDDEKNNHLGDLFYDTTTGYCYRFMVSGSTYSWQQLSDSDISEALALAQTAKDTADNKRRVFYSQPTPPYDAGDLWVQGSNGDILRCQTPKTSSQSYSIDDWILASKYTDDTLAQTANEKIDGLELGGRNLILDTSNLEKTVNVDNYYGKIVTDTNFFGLNVGDEYCIKVKVRTESGKILKLRVQFFTNDSNRTSVYGTDTVQNEEGYLTYKGKLTQAQRAYSQMQICLDANSSPEEAKTGITVEYYKELKLERGNRFTDWTPAPEDLKANQQLWYTTTSTVTAPSSSAVWSKTTPTTSNYYVWQKIITTYSNGTTEESDIACIYIPTVTISSIVTQYIIHTSKTTPPSNSASGWTDEKPAWQSSYYGSKYLWIRTKYSYTGGKAPDYSTPYYDPTWEALGELEKSMADSAELVNNSINNGTVQIHDGYIDINNGPNQGIRFSSGGISFKINNEYTSVWDITGKFNAEKILVENLTASSILSGTLTLKAANDESNGVFILQNAEGSEVARIDVNGLKVTAIDGSYVWLRTGEDDSTKKGLYLCDAQGNTYFQNDTTNGIVKIEKQEIQDYQEFANKVRIIPIGSGNTIRGIGFIGV